MKSRNRKNTLMGDEQGGSLVEFAIVGPLLFLLLFGIIEFGVLLYDQAMITNASREGARHGIVFSDPRVTDERIEDVVRLYCEEHLISFGAGSALTIPPPTRTGNGAGDELRVTVDYSFRFLVFSNVLAWLGGDGNSIINLRSVTVMRLE